MVVMIRLKRTGRRNRACYRLNAIEARNPRDGRVLENLGLYDPLAPKADKQLLLQKDRILHWLQAGAQLSETARALCKRLEIEIPEPKARVRKRKRSAVQVKHREERMRKLYKAKKERRDARVAAKKAAAAAAAAEGGEES